MIRGGDNSNVHIASSNLNSPTICGKRLIGKNFILYERIYQVLTKHAIFLIIYTGFPKERFLKFWKTNIFKIKNGARLNLFCLPKCVRVLTFSASKLEIVGFLFLTAIHDHIITYLSTHGYE